MKTKIVSVMALSVTIRLFAASDANENSVAREPGKSAPPAIAVLAPTVPAAEKSPLKWDTESKDYSPKPGELVAAYTFCVTNISNADVLINGLHTSCGCTVAQLPSTPYTLQPGSNVAINVSMQLAGRSGLVAKTINVDSTAGGQTLTVRANIPTDTKQSQTK